MAIIPLRQYNREIETLIDTAQLDEAVAHCRQILETFPKHIATYRLLGKAYLEQQRFGDAADIFQRVLSSVPDDHVANIGLSIIREDEGNLDAAIWYMERALEAQPSNSAIKDELRRLYGRRDGIEPPKVRLTRGALARMYSRGGLYDQAIAELRAALADDPNRPDLMVLLAQMYFYLGQQIEAVDTCGNIIKRLPYCLVANRILSSILPQTGRADDTKTYLQRVIAMDPYFASASVNMLTADAVPESAITIERLSYRPGQAAGGSAQPAWATSLGIAFEESPADQLPDWLQDQSALETEAKTAAQSVSAAPFSWEKSDEEAASSAQPTSPEDAIPDWMKQAGWQPASGEAFEQPLSFDMKAPAEPEGEITKAEIPDWLRGLAPAGSLDEETPPEQNIPEELDLPWLQKTTPGASDTIVNWLGAQKPTTQSTEEPEEPTQPESNLGALGAKPSVPGEDGGLPDWLQGVESSYGRSGITDWLKTSHVDEFEASLESSAEEPKQPEQEIPDWLKGIGEPTAELAPLEPVAEEPALPADELPEWFKEMGEPAVELAPLEPTVEEPALPADELPEWLKDIGEPAADLAPLESTVEEPALPADELPEWLKEIGEPTAELTPLEPVAEEPALPADELPEWLKEMGEPAAELAPLEPTVEEPALPADELPEWLKEMGEPTAELASVEPVAEELTLPIEERPEWVEQISAPAQVIDSSTPQSEEEVAPFEDLPYWLKETAKITPAELSSLPVDFTPEETSLPEIVLPDWLLELGKGVPSTTEPSLIKPEAKDEEIPTEEIPSRVPEIVEHPAPFIEPVLEPAQDTALPAEDLPAWLKEMGETPTETSSAFSDQSDQNAALSWLEALAAKHGAKEEELITRPDERLQTMPDWIKMEAEQSQSEQPIPALPSPVEEPAQPAEELPVWLKEIAEEANETAPVEPTPTPTPFMDQSDQDAALAWLEALASQHGAKEEEFITKPEERQESIPDWVKLGAEEALQAEAQIGLETSLPAQEATIPSEELPDWLQEIADAPVETAVVEPPVEAPSAARDLADQDAALAWLESLATQHGAREEELITPPEERLEVMPDWIKQEAESSLAEDEAPTQPVPVESIIPEIPAFEEIAEGVELLPEALLEPIEAIGEPLPSEEPVLPETELPDWLVETTEALAPAELIEDLVGEEQLPDWLKDTALPEPELPADDLASDMQKLPDWLKEVDQFAEGAADAFPSTELPATHAWMPEAILPETELPTPPAYVPSEQPSSKLVEAELPAQEPEILPSEPLALDINFISLSQLEQLPGIGFVTAQKIIAYREENGPFGSLDSLAQVDGVDPALIETLRDRLTTAIPEVVVITEPAVETEESIFASARRALAEGEVSLASDLYNRLISRSADLEQVIADMQNALYRYPLDINFWQIMGDAYLRTDKLQEALDAYTEAEELLR